MSKSQQIDWVVEQRIDYIVRLYRDGKSLRQVGKAVNLSHPRVRTILLEQGVTLRPPIRFPNTSDITASSRALLASITSHLGGDPRDAEITKLRGMLDDIQQAEAEYREMYARHGDGSRASGRAWDLMRRQGDRVRAMLNATGSGQ